MANEFYRWRPRLTLCVRYCRPLSILERTAPHLVRYRTDSSSTRDPQVNPTSGAAAAGHDYDYRSRAEDVASDARAQAKWTAARDQRRQVRRAHGEPSAGDK